MDNEKTTMDNRPCTMVGQRKLIDYISWSMVHGLWSMALPLLLNYFELLNYQDLRLFRPPVLAQSLNTKVVFRSYIHSPEIVIACAVHSDAII